MKGRSAASTRTHGAATSASPRRSAGTGPDSRRLFAHHPQLAGREHQPGPGRADHDHNSRAGRGRGRNHRGEQAALAHHERGLVGAPQPRRAPAGQHDRIDLKARDIRTAHGRAVTR